MKIIAHQQRFTSVTCIYLWWCSA